MLNPVFYAKILLFGEYGIIENAQGLSIPYLFYKGRFKFSELETDFEKESNHSLKKYAEYLRNLEYLEGFRLNLSQFSDDIENGLFFDSDIPQGYGVGSSGALVAAIFDRYSIEKVDIENLTQNQFKDLKAFLGEMESFFHGKSSGIDPLICYLNSPILIQNKENISRVEIPKENQGEGAIFLIDSQMIGETEPMVRLFFEKMKSEDFRKTLKEDFIKYNDACIHAFLNQENTMLFKNIKFLSEWTYKHFRPMIPQSVVKIWREGLDSNIYSLKLCGSGGGGYILGFTEDFYNTEAVLKDFPLKVIHRL